MAEAQLVAQLAIGRKCSADFTWYCLIQEGPGPPALEAPRVIATAEQLADRGNATESTDSGLTVEGRFAFLGAKAQWQPLRASLILAFSMAARRFLW
jgi:hypothetical protein